MPRQSSTTVPKAGGRLFSMEILVKGLIFDTATADTVADAAAAAAAGCHHLSIILYFRDNSTTNAGSFGACEIVRKLKLF